MKKVSKLEDFKNFGARIGARFFFRFGIPFCQIFFKAILIESDIVRIALDFNLDRITLYSSYRTDPLKSIPKAKVKRIRNFAIDSSL